MSFDKGSLYIDQDLKSSNKNNIINLKKLGFMPQVSLKMQLTLEFNWILIINNKECCLFNELTITETFFYFGKLYCISTKNIKKKKDFLLKLLDLPSLNTSICSLSGGQLRRVSFAVSLINQPDLLMLGLILT